MKRLNNLYRRHFKRDIIVLLLIVAIPFLFFSYMLVPENLQTWDTWLFIFESKNFWSGEDIDIIFWRISIKTLTLSILSLWLITCKHWWRYTLIIPLIEEIYKLIRTFVDYSFWQCLIFSTIFILLLLVISKKVGFYSKPKNANSELNIEISELMTKLSKVNKQEYSSIKEQLIDLRSKKHTLTKKEYLVQLIALQDSMAV